MKKLLILIAAILFLSSCKNKDIQSLNPKHYEIERFNISDGFIIHKIHRIIDKELNIVCFTGYDAIACVKINLEPEKPK